MYCSVTPAKAGVQNLLKILDSGLRRNDVKHNFCTFYETINFKEIKKLLAPAFATIAFPLGNALNIQGMRIVVGIMIGPSAVAGFTALRTLSRLAMQPRAVANQILEPELAMAYGSRDSSRFGKIYAVACQTALWATIGACLLLVMVGAFVFPIWTGGKIALHWPAFLMLLAAVAVNSVWYTALMVPYATNRHGRIALNYGMIYGAAAIALAFASIPSLGITGAGISLLIVEAAMSFVVIPVALKLSGQSFKGWMETTIKPPFSQIPHAVFLFLNTLGIKRGGRK